MKLIVGLGNPGARYDGTRHNIGFDAVDELARRYGLVFEASPSDAVMARERGPGARVMLAKPLTFMNLSGRAVAELARFYRVAPADILVIMDDSNLPLGRMRARAEGSDGGHNGLKSVIELLGTRAVPRLRLGVGRGDVRRDLASHVLARFDEDERDAKEKMIESAVEAAGLFVEEGITQVMNRFNAKPLDEAEKHEEETTDGR